jgi:hypothetical protein
MILNGTAKFSASAAISIMDKRRRCLAKEGKSGSAEDRVLHLSPPFLQIP